MARLGETYDGFEERVAGATSWANKQQRVRDFVLHQGPVEFRIADVRRALPGVSDNTIRLVLAELKAADLVANDGTGRSASWRRRRREIIA